jgi:hypothetical protein
MVTVADPEELVFAMETAVTVTGVVVTPPLPFEVVGTPPGATKRPEVEIYPLAWLPPVTPFTCQVTAVLGTPFTVAVNCCVVKMATLTGLGVTTTLTAVCCPIVTEAEPESAAFAAETAVTVTVAGLGIVPGALYNPFVLIVPTVALPPVAPFTCQVTAVFVLPVTAAMNCLLALGLTVAEAGVTVTVIGGGGGAFPPPQEQRNRKTTRLGTRKTTNRMRSLAEGGNIYISIGNFRWAKGFDTQQLDRNRTSTRGRQCKPPAFDSDGFWTLL